MDPIEENNFIRILKRQINTFSRIHLRNIVSLDIFKKSTITVKKKIRISFIHSHNMYVLTNM